jgi:hypothetical protein
MVSMRNIFKSLIIAILTLQARILLARMKPKVAMIKDLKMFLIDTMLWGSEYLQNRVYLFFIKYML